MGTLRPHVVAVDLSTADGTRQLAEILAEQGLEPAYVINNAGFGLLGEAATLDRERQLAMIDLNVRAMTDLSLRFVASVKRYGGGILNVASIAAFIPGPGMAVYHATKSYVLSFTEALHYELADEGVQVCALCPGPVPTEFFNRAGIPRDYFPRSLGALRITGSPRRVSRCDGKAECGRPRKAQPCLCPAGQIASTGMVPCVSAAALESASCKLVR